MGGIWQCVCGRGVITGFHNIWRMLPTFVRHRSTMLPPLQRAAQPPGQDPILNASDRFILTNEFRMQRRLWDHRGSRLHSSSKVPESCVSVPTTHPPLARGSQGMRRNTDCLEWEAERRPESRRLPVAPLFPFSFSRFSC